MTLQVESPTVYTSQGVPISVTGIAQVNIATVQRTGNRTDFSFSKFCRSGKNSGAKSRNADDGLRTVLR